jgi:hypothetical protein
VHRAGYVFCVLEQFHQRLQRRDIFASASSRWADPRAQLLTGEAWEATKGPVLNALQLPEDPERLFEEHARDLDAALREVAGRLDADVQASVDAEGRLHALALAAIPDPPSLIDLRKRTEAMMPRVDIGELILEVMSWHPRFLQAFTALSGGESRLDNLNVSIAAALTAQALNIGYGPVISPGVEALTRDRISHVDQSYLHVDQSYLRADTVAPANAPLIDAQADITLARDHLGGGLVAAVDGIRFVVPVRSIDARPNPKYFGRRRGATWLNLINDVGAGLAGMVVSGTARDSLHIIDLIYRQKAGQRPEVIISDAHGLHVQRQRLLERRRERHHPVLAPLALGDADPAGIEVDVVEPDGDELGDAHAGIEQGLDEHDVAPTLLPHRLVVAADLGLGGDIGQALGFALDLHVQFGAEVTEDLLQVDVVGSLPPEMLGELAGLLPGWCALCRRRGRTLGGFAHRTACGKPRSRWRSICRLNCP